MPTLGNRLLGLKERSGLSLAAIAERAGYKNPSSIQKLFHAEYNPQYLSAKVASKLARAMVGLGIPEITPGELASLAGQGDPILNNIAVARYKQFKIKDEIELVSTEQVDQVFFDENKQALPIFMLMATNEFYVRPSGDTETEFIVLEYKLSNLRPSLKKGDFILFKKVALPALGELSILLLRFSENMLDVAVAGVVEKSENEILVITQSSPKLSFTVKQAHISETWQQGNAFDLLGKRKNIQKDVD